MSLSISQPLDFVPAGDAPVIEEHILSIPFLNANRRVRVCIPSDYDSGHHDYPVIYMMDGQNLFGTSTEQQPGWEVDLQLDPYAIQTGRSFIVVGVDHGGTERIAEYSPWPHAEWGGGKGRLFTEFLVKTLKPFVDRHYRSRRGAEDTIIMGSSMGGLLSLYAAVEYPDVFGKAVVFSPSLWFAGEIFDFVNARRPRDGQQFFLLAGQRESEDMTADMARLYFSLVQTEPAEDSIGLRIIEQGEHHESLWREAFIPALDWFYEQRVSDGLPGAPVHVRYTGDTVSVRVDRRISWPSVRISSLNGSLIKESPLFYCTNTFQVKDYHQEVHVSLRSGNREVWAVTMEQSRAELPAAI